MAVPDVIAWADWSLFGVWDAQTVRVGILSFLWGTDGRQYAVAFPVSRVGDSPPIGRVCLILIQELTVIG